MLNSLIIWLFCHILQQVSHIEQLFSCATSVDETMDSLRCRAFHYNGMIIIWSFIKASFSYRWNQRCHVNDTIKHRTNTERVSFNESLQVPNSIV